MKARVSRDYTPRTRVELSLTVKDVIENVEKVDESWFSGHLHGQTGICPSSCIEIIECDQPGEMEKEFLDRAIKEKIKSNILQPVLYSFCPTNSVEASELPIPKLVIDSDRSSDGERQLQDSTTSFPHFREMFGHGIIRVSHQIRFTKEDPDVGLEGVLKNLKRHTVIIGEAGSGKTTLLRIIARKTFRRELGNFELVHVIDNQIFVANTKCSASEALFSNFEQSDAEYLMKFAVKNPTRCLFLYDSLDTLRQNLREVPDPGSEYDPNDRLEAMKHLKMLVSGKLLGECHLLTTSRPNYIYDMIQDIERSSKSTKNLAPNLKYSLKGFSLENMKIFVHLYCNEAQKADKIYNIVRERPDLRLLCRQPIFLLCVTIIMTQQNDLSYETNGITKVVLDILNTFLQRDNAQANYLAIADRLKQFCLDMLVESRFVFYENDLLERHMSIEDIRDLCKIEQKSSSNCAFSLIKGKNPIIFSHQLIQEMLAAIRISEYDSDTFVKTCGRLIHRSSFWKTRELLFGLVFSNEQLRLRNVSQKVQNVEMKRIHLMESIIKEYNSQQIPQFKIFLAQTLAETVGADTKFTRFADLDMKDDINFSRLQLTNWQCYCTGLFASRFEFLNQLLLEHCGIKASELAALIAGLLKYPINCLQIAEFSLKGNDLDAECMATACKIVIECKTNAFNVAKCGIDTKVITTMKQGLGEYKLYKLVLKGNSLSVDGMQIAGSIVRNCSIKDLDLTNCAKGSSEAKQFTQHVEGSTMDYVRIADNSGDVISGYGGILSLSQVKCLAITLTAAKDMDIEYFNSLARDRQVDKLVLMNKYRKRTRSNNTEAQNSVSLLIPFVREELKVEARLSNFETKEIQKNLNALPNMGPVVRLGEKGSVTIISDERRMIDLAKDCEMVGSLSPGEVLHSRIEGKSEIDMCASAILISRYESTKKDFLSPVGKTPHMKIKDMPELQACEDATLDFEERKPNPEKHEKTGVQSLGKGSDGQEFGDLPTTKKNAVNVLIDDAGYVPCNEKHLPPGNEEDLRAMEREFTKLRKGSDVIAWIRKHEERQEQITDIMRAYGLTIYNHEMNEKDYELIANVLKFSPRSFGFCFSKGFPRLLEELKKGGTKFTVKELCFSGWSELNEHTVQQFIQFVSLCSASRLILRSNCVNERALQDLKDQIEKHIVEMNCLRALAINHNGDFGTEGWKIVAEIATLFPDDHLKLSVCNCGLTDEYLVTLKDHLRGKKLRGLNISSNRGISEKGFRTAGQIAKSCAVKSMGMSNCGLNSVKFNKFSEEATEANIETLKLGNNPCIGKDGLENIKESIQNLGVKKLDLSNCRLTDVELNLPVNILNVSGNSKIQDIEKVANFVDEELRIHNCMLAYSEVVDLSKAIVTRRQRDQRPGKMRKIEISERSRQTSSQMLEHLATAFDGVVDVLSIQSYEIPDLNYQAMKKSLMKFKYDSILISPLLHLTPGESRTTPTVEQRNGQEVED